MLLFLQKKKAFLLFRIPSNPATPAPSTASVPGSATPTLLPACGACPVARWCPAYGTGETDPERARKLLAYELAPPRADA